MDHFPPAIIIELGSATVFTKPSYVAKDVSLILYFAFENQQKYFLWRT
jgi:hypothetical protein